MDFQTKQPNILSLGVHGGKFHLDDIFCCYLMSFLYGKRCNNEVIINRILNDDFENCDIVMDVGRIYDHTMKRYDHHQQNYNEYYGKKLIKMAASGLIWKHYGINIVKAILNDMKDEYNYELNNNDINYIVNKIYNDFILIIDAVDNGYNAFDTSVKCLYINNTTLSHYISLLNEKWYETLTQEQIMNRFKQGMEIVGNYFNIISKDIIYSVQAKKLADKAYKNRFNYRKDGRIIVIDNIKIPLNIHTFNKYTNPKILYIIGYDTSRQQYNILAVSDKPNSYTSLCPFPKEWRGLDKNKLSAVTNIENCTFVHLTGFLGANKTLDGALQMANTSIDLYLLNKKQHTYSKLILIFIICNIIYFIYFIIKYIY